MPEVNTRQENIKAEKTRRPPKKITETYLHNAGLHYLQRFAASSAHFRKVMMRKIDRSCRHHKDQNREDCAALLETLIEKFSRAGLLNDTAYTQGLVHSLRRRGLSTRMVKSRLIARGIGAGQAEQALRELQETEGEDSELAAALKLARRKKIGPYALSKGDEKTRNRALAILARAGFDYETAEKIMRMNREDLEN